MKKTASLILALMLLLSVIPAGAASAFAMSDGYAGEIADVDLGTAAPGYDCADYVGHPIVTNTGSVNFMIGSPFTRLELSGSDYDKFQWGINGNGWTTPGNTFDSIWIKPVDGLGAGYYTATATLESSDVAGEYNEVADCKVTFTVLPDGVENWGTAELVLAYGEVTYFDEGVDTLLGMLNGIAAEGIIDRGSSMQSFDLDKDGSIDFEHDNMVYEGGKSSTFRKCEGKSIVGEYEIIVPDSVKNAQIAAGHSYADKIVIVFEDICPKGGEHKWEMSVDKATFGKSGMTYGQCTKCGKKQMGMPILPVDASIEAAVYTFDGKAKTPKVNVSTYDGPLDKQYYKVEYINNVNPGTATVKITLLGDYFEGTKTFNFPIEKPAVKLANPLVAKGKTVKIKNSVIKNKSVKVKRKKAITIKNAKGKVTYKKAKGNKKITVSKAGNITVKKGLKKGTYKVKIKVTAAGDSCYKKTTKTVTVKIAVK